MGAGDGDFGGRVGTGSLTHLTFGSDEEGETR
jgi:hypothetical protein